ncbi:MAG: hypothetical protein HQM08_21175 [Candidatus Riflebacteria bacterium]|nr:hypothetical protein [Candidatus Riflebacteria bacterium]
MPESSSRERDLVLAPNEYAFISDQTKGNINVYVGPYKTSLANTDQPVIFNEKTKRFERCHLEEAIQVFATAPEGWYVILKNPSKDSNQPKTGTVSNLAELKIGKKVNFPGPLFFALWPGQMSRIVEGHHLHSNQYLIVRVYDEEAAKENWKKAVVKRQAGQGSENDSNADIDVSDISLGKLIAIKGTDVSFYIPPTGIEVVRDENENYVREAVSLERLEYCILLNEDGNKRYIQGPAVVFPQPSETFVEMNLSRKFKAIELNEISGLYIKVIAPYKENNREYKVGEELFLTGKDQMIYSPRPEHAIIKYGDQEIHYAVAIPAGEGRYVLNRRTGKISLARGPAMLLPDPREEVIVRRIIDPKDVELWYPGNIEALEYNKRLKQLTAGSKEEYLSDHDARTAVPATLKKEDQEKRADRLAIVGDDFVRSNKYTPPRTITLDTKYEGSVSIGIWTGYAVLVVSKTGERKVIVGPRTCLLEYDESLESMIMSTGTPKSDTKLLKTSYLRVLHNKVSDSVIGETNDLCKIEVLLSYRVNFEGDPNNWFNVENYVKFLCEHMRSLIRNSIKNFGIEQFYASAIKIIRDTVLGTSGEDGKRTGRVFEENGMRIYDVEILDVKIGDASIANLLFQTQHEVVKQAVLVTSERRRLETTKHLEEIKRAIASTQTVTKHQEEEIKRVIAEAQGATRQGELEIQVKEEIKLLEVNLAKINSEIETRKKNLEAKKMEQESINKIDEAERLRKRENIELEIEIARKKLDQYITELKAEVEAVVEKTKAVSPDLIAALQAFGDRALAEKMAQSMAPLAILGGKSISDVLGQLLKGTAIEKVLHLANKVEPPKK